MGLLSVECKVMTESLRLSVILYDGYCYVVWPM